jgi:hypothetical protein
MEPESSFCVHKIPYSFCRELAESNPYLHTALEAYISICT